ncbi:MAG: SurA N-terminal domain-containing protein [Anaerolineae bacterium]|nr:SurA N-terminal domain-containing protein [Anaerolineae bacterium]
MTKKVRRTPKQQLTRKQRSRLDEERRVERILIWGVSIVAILIVGVLGYGVVAERIIEPREPVAIVDETPITTEDFKARVKFRRLQLTNQLSYLYQQQQAMAAQDSESGGQSLQEYFQQQIDNLQSQLAPENAESLGRQVLDQMIQERLVQQEAERRDIGVTAEEVQREVHANFGYDPDATPVPTVSPPVTATDSLTTSQPTPAPVPTQMTEADFREMYNRYMQEGLQPIGISEQQYRSWVRASLLTEQLQADMKEELPQQADQVELRFLSVGSQERANDLVARLDGGEDFEALAEEIKEDEESPGSSSELSWLPQDVLADRLGEELAATVFNLDVGEHTEPVTLGEEGQSYYIFEVTGHEERELDDAILEQMAQERFQSWLEAQQSLVERRSIQGVVPTEP